MSATVVATTDEAVAGIADGSVVLVGGFGLAGMPFDLIDALIRQGAMDLTVVSNNAGNGDTGLAALLADETLARTMRESCPALAVLPVDAVRKNLTDLAAGSDEANQADETADGGAGSPAAASGDAPRGGGPLDLEGVGQPCQVRHPAHGGPGVADRQVVAVEPRVAGGHGEEPQGGDVDGGHLRHVDDDLVVIGDSITGDSRSLVDPAHRSSSPLVVRWTIGDAVSVL